MYQVDRRAGVFEDAIHEVESRLFDQHLERFDKQINQPEFHTYKHYIVGIGRLNYPALT